MTFLFTLIWPYLVGVPVAFLYYHWLQVNNPFQLYPSPFVALMAFWPAAVCRLALAALAWWFAVFNLRRRRFIKGWRKPRGEEVLKYFSSHSRPASELRKQTT